MLIDLNADLGEGFGSWKMGDDAAMMDIVTTANIACGFHAGDPETMRTAITSARDRGVAVGAHPGYADLTNFGRRPMAGVTAREIENLVAYQVGAFQGMAALAGHVACHVKTHGALGNLCAGDDQFAVAVARGIRAADASLAFMVMPGTATERAADRAGLRPIREIYADRTYADDFNLTPRAVDGAVIHDTDVATRRVIDMVESGTLTSLSGKVLRVDIDSICVHGDNPAACAMARSIRFALEKSGRTLAPAA